MKYAKTECYSMATDVKHRKYRLLGHVLRMGQKMIPKKGLRWNSPGKRNQKKPKMTLRKNLWRRLKIKQKWETAGILSTYTAAFFRSFLICHQHWPLFLIFSVNLLFLKKSSCLFMYTLRLLRTISVWNFISSFKNFFFY